MARIAGVNLPLNKRSEIGLTYIYGIGRATAKEILEQVDVSPDTYVRDLTEDEVAKLRAAIDDGRTVEGDLRRERSPDIKRLQEIGCYRGLRHRRGLPVRGQQTKPNARARKGLEQGLQKVDVYVKGPGSGRETAIRSLQAAGLEVSAVKDVTPQAHNGCRPRKRRRV